MQLSPFMKGALGFLGCAALCGGAYAIGKSVGREEALKEVEREEKRQPEPKPLLLVQEAPSTTEQSADIIAKPTTITPVEVPMQSPQPSIVERVRQKHEKKGGLLGGISTVKDLLGGNLDGKQLTVTTDGGDIIARISQKQGG